MVDSSDHGVRGGAAQAGVGVEEEEAERGRVA
jgi:hypothetical protein